MAMRRRLFLCACALVLPAAASAAPKQADTHRFAVIGHSFGEGSEDRFKQAIEEASDKTLSFVVVTGIKGAAEGCSDKLYQQRRDLLDDAKRPVIVAPAGSDWTDCKNSAGRSNAIERLNRLRELLYPDPSSLGAKKIQLTRQSMSPRFRSYAENAHWEVGTVLYATVNLPANNNHYLAAAGRNSEYEDRLVANRFWLNRLFAIARRDKLDAVVLFSEGDVQPFLKPPGLGALLRRTPAVQDGFAETRKQLVSLAQKFGGKVLLVDGAGLPKGGKPAIEWQGNMGHVSIGPGAVEVKVAPGVNPVFTLKDATP